MNWPRHAATSSTQILLLVLDVIQIRGQRTVRDRNHQLFQLFVRGASCKERRIACNSRCVSGESRTSGAHSQSKSRTRSNLDLAPCANRDSAHTCAASANTAACCKLAALPLGTRYTRQLWARAENSDPLNAPWCCARQTRSAAFWPATPTCAP